MSGTTPAKRNPPVRAAGLLLVLGIGLTIGGVATARAADEPTTEPAASGVTLGAADAFVLLAEREITNTSSLTVADAEIGVSAGSAVTGFPPGRQTAGTIHSSDTVAVAAKVDLTTAYNEAAARPATATVGRELGGLTLGEGVYSGGAMEITGTLTLTGDKDSVFVFQAQSTLVTATSSRVALVGGVQPSNVFWQIGSSATLGTYSDFTGTILSRTSIQSQTGTIVAGRLLARGGSVTLDATKITKPVACVEPEPEPSASPVPSGSPTPKPSPKPSPSASGPACPE